jgi:hypothetical protein
MSKLLLKEKKTKNQGKTIKQIKFLKIYKESLADKGITSRNTLKEIARQAGYGEVMANAPERITKSKAIRPELEELRNKLTDINSRVLDHITDAKLDKSNAKDLAFSFDKLQKHINIIQGDPTENINKRIISLDIVALKQLSN